MQIFAITFGYANMPSTRYRLLQFERLLKARGHSLRWVCQWDYRRDSQAYANDVLAADLVIVQKAALPLELARPLRTLAGRIIFEWDDAIYTTPGDPQHRTAEDFPELVWWLMNADAVSCSNRFLGEISAHFNSRVQPIPNCLDLAALSSLEPREVRATPVIGWSGCGGSENYIQTLVARLAPWLRQNPHVRLRVMSDRDPKLQGVPYEYVVWSAETEGAFFGGLDIGLLPLLPDDAHSRAKFPIKYLSYASYGVPTVADFVGGGPAEIMAHGGRLYVQDGDWGEALAAALEPRTYRRLSREALEVVRTHYEQKAVFERWLSLWSGVAANRRLRAPMSYGDFGAKVLKTADKAAVDPLSSP